MLQLSKQEKLRKQPAFPKDLVLHDALDSDSLSCHLVLCNPYHAGVCGEEVGEEVGEQEVLVQVGLNESVSS